MDTDNLIGGAGLAVRYAITPVIPLAVLSRIGGRRRTEEVDGVAIETFVEAMRPAANLRGHLTFHLKHEVLHLTAAIGGTYVDVVDERKLVAASPG